MNERISYTSHAAAVLAAGERDVRGAGRLELAPRCQDRLDVLDLQSDEVVVHLGPCLRQVILQLLQELLGIFPCDDGCFRVPGGGYGRGLDIIPPPGCATPKSRLLKYLLS